jgi:hypothetical protein
MDSFVGPRRSSRGYGSLEVYNSKIEFGLIEFPECIAPDVIEAQGTGYRSVCFLGKLDILTRVAHVRFVQARIHRMWQRLINAAAGHDVAAEKQTQRHD